MGMWPSSERSIRACRSAASTIRR